MGSYFWQTGPLRSKGKAQAPPLRDGNPRQGDDWVAVKELKFKFSSHNGNI